MYKFDKSRSAEGIYDLKQAYDAIYQQNQSYRESLLMSPHCSKFERHSPARFLNENDLNTFDNSLSEYIRPFESEQLHKTEAKKTWKNRKGEVDCRKKTEPQSSPRSRSNFDRKYENLQNLVISLKLAIEQRDQRITLLQKNMSMLSSKHLLSSKHSVSFASPPKKTQRIETEQNEQKITNLKKQIIFLTHNNQQLYEQVHRLSIYCQKQKKVLNKSISYSRELEHKISQISQKLNESERLNRALMSEKKEMMENYQIELQLFLKMKKVWEDSNACNFKKTIKTDRTESKKQSHKSASQFHQKNKSGYH